MGEQLTPLRWLTTWCSPSLRPWLLGNNAHTHWPTPCRAAPLEPRGYPATSTSQKSVDEKYADVLACPEHVVRAGGKDYAAFFAHPPRGFFYCLLELTRRMARARVRRALVWSHLFLARHCTLRRTVRLCLLWRLLPT